MMNDRLTGPCLLSWRETLTKEWTFYPIMTDGVSQEPFLLTPLSVF